MKELSKEELLEWLKRVYFYYTQDIEIERDKQAYQQINKLIDKEG